MAVGVPVALVAVLSPATMTFLSVFMTMLAVSAWFYFFFAIDALFISRVSPWQALRMSLAIVRTYFWSSAGLIGLTLLISNGLNILWAALAAQAWGLVLGIVGNAYIGSGLAAASMLFYRDRSGLLIAASVQDRPPAGPRPGLPT